MNEYCDKCEEPVAKVHRLPKNEERAKKWLESLEWDEVNTCGKQWANLYICDGHFTTESYRNGKRDQPLVHGAVPTIINPIVYDGAVHLDHDYVSKKMKRMRNDSSIHKDVEMEEIADVPALKKNISQQSQSTDITWNSMNTRASNEVFMDIESKAERKSRMESENQAILSTGLSYSLMAHSSFLELLDFTPGCLKCRCISAKRTFRTIGNALEMQTECPNCGRWTWCSSQRVHDDRLGGILESNMDMSISTFISGIPYERMDDMCKAMKMGTPRRKTHYEIIRDHVKPTVDLVYDEEMLDTRERIFKANESGSNANKTSLSIVGDAQYDSRGFSASVCRYITMDYQTRLILDFEIQIRKENQGNSPIMESRAFAKIMERLANDDKFSIERVTTDKNASVISYLHKNYPNIQHRLDKWHVIKLIKKHNLAAIERKKNSNLRLHWEHLLVHIWTSIEAADGNAELAVELIRSAEYHLQHIHDLPKDKFSLINKCMHGPLQDDPSNRKAYLDPIKHTSQIAVLHELLNNSTFLDNVRRCAARETTSPCESFHSLAALIYLKKNIYYDKHTTSTLTKLCAMHHNSHRKEIMDRESQGINPPTRKKYSRAQKRTREVVHQIKPSLIWKAELLTRAKQHYFEKKEVRIANRVLGRPKKLYALTSTSPVPSSSEESDDDDDVDALDELGSEIDEDEIEEIEEIEELSSQELILPPPNQSCNIVYGPATPKQVIKVSPRQYDKVYSSMGAAADDYIYVHNRTGERILGKQ